jgi:hypothetical protein
MLCDASPDLLVLRAAAVSSVYTWWIEPAAG